MPEPQSQAAPTEPVSPPSVPVPEVAPPPVSPQVEPQTDQPLTLETMRQIAKEVATSIAQSQVAKGENRINQRIQEQFKALELNRSALGLTDDQVTQARQRIVTDAFTAPEPEPTPPTPASEADQAVQFLNDQIDTVFAEVGTSVAPTDPEFADLQKAITDNWNDPKGLAKILRVADRVATTKAQRLQKNNDTAAARVTGAVIPSGVQPSVKNSHEAWEQAYKK